MSKKFIQSCWFSFDECLVVKDNALLDVKEKYRYEDGKKTDVIEAYKYCLVNLGTYENFDVSISHNNPIITKHDLEELKQRGETIIVRLKNPKIRGYYNSFTNSIADNIVAEDLIIVKK